MTIQEAIEMLKDWNEDLALSDDEEEGIECHNLAIEALEKQIPKKPAFSHNFSDTVSGFFCECGNRIKVKHDSGIMNNNNAPNYCSKCGQKLDWSEEGNTRLDLMRECAEGVE